MNGARWLSSDWHTPTGPTLHTSTHAFYLELQQEGRTVVQCMIKFNMFQFSHNYSDRKMKSVVLILLSEFGIWTR